MSESKDQRSELDKEIDAFKIPFVEYSPLIFDGCATLFVVFFSLFSILIIILFSLYIGTIEKVFYDEGLLKALDTSSQGLEINECYLGVTSPCIEAGALKPIDLQNYY